MGLGNVNIRLENGALGRVATTADGVAGLILTGKAVPDKLELNRVYLFGSVRDLTTHGITEEGNPLLYKEVAAFYEQAGDGAELYVLVVSEATTLTQMCSAEDGSPLKKLIDHAAGRIRLVGVNKLPPAEYEAGTAQGVDGDVITAVAAAQNVATAYQAKINPFRMLLPAILWNGSTENLFKPREGSYNRVGLVLAADKIIGETASPAVGRVLGRAAKIAVNRSIARVKDGTIAATGFLADGKTPEEDAGMLDVLHDAGYILFRTFVGKNGYYLNDDCMAAPLTDDYSNLNLGRVIDKAIIIAYGAYVDEIQDSIEVDDNGQLPQYLCSYFEGNMENAVAASMQEEISNFECFIDPAQNILSAGFLAVGCKIVPKGILKEINVTLGFDNPALKA